jgi:putative chitobiose transport system permease protein
MQTRVKMPWLWHSLLMGWGLLSLFPLWWLWQVAVTPLGLPLGTASLGQWQWGSFGQVFQQMPFAAFTLNSILLCLVSMSITLTTSVLVAFPLACLRFQGQKWVNGLVLLSVIVPFQVLMIPLFLLCQRAGLTEAHGYLPMLLGLTLPFWISGFGILLLKQAFANIPTSLLDAAVLDGCTPWQRLWHIALPLIQPSLGLLTVLTFLASWGELLWPSLMLSDPQHFPLSVGLVQLQGAFSSNWRLIAAGSLLGILPVMVVFLLAQKLFIPQATAGAVKG